MASDRKYIIGLLLSVVLLVFLFVPAVSSIPVSAMRKIIYDSGGKPLLGGSTDPAGNEVEVQKPVCMRWPSCEDDVSPTPSPVVPNTVSEKTFTSSTPPIAPTVKVKGQPVQGTAPTTATVYALPSSVSQTGYSNADGSVVIPPKSPELLAYEAQTGIVSEPVVVTFKQGDTSGMTVGYQAPPPKYAEPGGYWMDGGYIQPSGTSYADTLAKEITSVQKDTAGGVTTYYDSKGNSITDYVYMCEIPNIGWIQCTSAGVPLSILKPLATVPMLSVIRLSILGRWW